MCYFTGLWTCQSVLCSSIAIYYYSPLIRLATDCNHKILQRTSHTFGPADVSATSRAATATTCSRQSSTDGSGVALESSWPRPMPPHQDGHTSLGPIPDTRPSSKAGTCPSLTMLSLTSTSPSKPAWVRYLGTSFCKYWQNPAPVCLCSSFLFHNAMTTIIV